MTLAVSTAPPSRLRDTATATSVCATEVVSPEFIDESCEAFESYGKREDEEFLDDEDTSNSIWHLLSTIYIPLLFLRLRRSFSGMTGLIRSLLLGQCLRFLAWETLAPWLQPLIGNPNAKDPYAWPPPTLRILAILTIVAFIVHPDGMTWIMLGKLRNAIYTLLESSTTCWNIVITDYGIFPTLAALATFASMIMLIYVLHRTLAPRTPRNQKMKTSERKKKKRKGNHPRGGRGRIKGKAKHHSAETRRPPRKVKEDLPAKVDEEEEEDVASIDTLQHKTEFLPKELTSKGPSMEPSRQRVTSCSTVETVAMDDQSIESASVQSIASAPSASSTTVSHSPRSLRRLEEGTKKSKNSDKRRTNTNKRGRKGSASKGSGAVVASPSRPDVSLPSTTKTNVNSPATTVHTPNTGRLRARRSGNPNGRAVADRMSSPVPASNDSLFSTPLSSPTHASTRTGKMTPSHVSDLKAPVLTPPTPLSSSLFSREPSDVTNTPTSHYSANTVPAAQSGGSNVFYKAQNYAASHSGSQSNGRYAPGKMELSAFLAQVGLVGTVCDDLVEALDDVDALYRLSDAQYELYNVSPDKKLRIDMMLEARRRAHLESRVLSSPSASSPGAIRPPPGLSVPVAKPENQTTVHMSPPHLNQATYASESSPSIGYLNRIDIDFGGSPSPGGKPQLPSLLSSYDVPNSAFYEQGDEEIEAELQQLGGQMVGSIFNDD